MEIEKLYSIYQSCDKVNTDSRTIKEGDLFFAINGEIFDGNEYAEQALMNGAKYAVIDNPKYVDLPNTILVNDSLATLQELAKFHRQKLHIPVIGLTGSNGKTTTKELINGVLSKKYNCLATSGNFNNHIGVPLTLLRINKTHEMAIIEMGANHTKEIEFLCEIAQPNYGLITNIGKAHIGEFGGFEKIIEAKLELYKSISKSNGCLFVNADDVRLMENSIEINRLLYGTKESAHYRGEYLRADPFVSLNYITEDIEINSQIIGKYNFDNFMVAIAIGAFFEVSTQDIKTALEKYVPSNNRSQIVKTDRNTLILDAYNANPSSVEVAIENILSMKGESKFFILGDMLELGEESAEEHAKIYELAKNNIDQGIVIGAEFKSIFSETEGVKSFQTTKEALHYLADVELKDKLILIKGSRGMKLEQLCEML